MMTFTTTHQRSDQKCSSTLDGHRHGIENYPPCVRVRCSCAWTSDWVDTGMTVLLGFDPDEEVDYKWEVHQHLASDPGCDCPFHLRRHEGEDLW